ncbi:MAG TPA: glucodextranase DOMON-like domain-containing protein [Bacillota bacterium]|nr:glucodextranase DOMON-like domain-containing protein [Bacillota bacterium]
MRWQRFAWVLLLLFMIGAKSGPEIFFEMPDPIGDDFGPGSYLYPRNIAFEPYKGLFDLRNFKVWREKPESIYFDLKMTKITNPWAAPEGFIHPVIHVYIDARPGGEILQATHGPNVRFSPKYGWEFCLIAAGWGNSRIIAFDEGGKPIVEGLNAELLSDQSTIRLTVPATFTGVPSPKWRYYVLVGSYDGLGPGLFRDIRKQEGEWAFGGGSDAKNEPRVLDLLAPEKGEFSQENQLRVDPQKGGGIMLTPVGDGLTSGFRWWPQAGWMALIAAVVAGLVWAWRSGRIFIFWHAEKNGQTDQAGNKDSVKA